MGRPVLAAQSADGELLLQRRVRADASPLTAFDISRAGSFLGVGTSEGAAALHLALSPCCPAPQLRLIQC
jgi:hypothetical protein